MVGSRPREVEDDGIVSDDDVIEEGDGDTWFEMGMTKEEKIVVRRPWHNSLIIKLVGGNHRTLVSMEATTGNVEDASRAIAH